MKKNVGLFGIPELADDVGFHTLLKNTQTRAEALVKEACDPDRKRKLVQVFDELSDTLYRVAGIANFVRIAHPDQRYAQAAEDAYVSVSAIGEKLNTNVDIHAALRHALDHGEKFPVDDVDVPALSGIHLEEKKREKFVKLNEQILMLGIDFQQRCQQPRSINKNQLPEHLRYLFTLDGDNVILSGLYSDHHSGMVREAAYKIYLYPDEQQNQLLESVLAARNELAELVGFPTYTHRALQGTLGETPENVTSFLETLSDKIQPIAEAEFHEIGRVKARHHALSTVSSSEVMPWDAAYFTGLARHDHSKIILDLQPYFSLGACMEGLSNLFNSLFGVTLRYEEPEYGEVWSHDVHKLAAVHENEGLLGHIYCDFFERSGKPYQGCHSTIQVGRLQDDGTYQHPIVVLMLNLPPPQGRVPSLLMPDMVDILFHEFGHAMHSMLGRTQFHHQTVASCSTDFIEVPSILMEYFATDARVLATFAKHWQTGEPLAEDKIRNLSATKKMFAASEMQHEVFYSMLDQIFHGKHPLPKSTIELLRDIQKEFYSLPYVENTAWHLRFPHFVEYGAECYSYLMSRAVAARIWHQCFKKDPLNREMGERYRRNMLAFGGEKHPSILVENMLGEKPTTDMLVGSLVDDLRNE